MKNSLLYAETNLFSFSANPCYVRKSPILPLQTQELQELLFKIKPAEPFSRFCVISLGFIDFKRQSKYSTERVHNATQKLVIDNAVPTLWSQVRLCLTLTFPPQNISIDTNDVNSFHLISLFGSK